MNNLKKIYFLISLLFILFLLYFNNFYISLAISGFDISNVQIFEDSNHDAPWDYRVIVTSKNNQPVIVYSQKNNMGIWGVQLYNYWEEDNIVKMNWTTYHDYPLRSVEHYLLYGISNNREITFPENFIPDGINIDIIQNQDFFEIHLYRTHGNEEESILHAFIYNSLIDYLVEHEFITP